MELGHCTVLLMFQYWYLYFHLNCTIFKKNCDIVYYSLQQVYAFFK